MADAAKNKLFMEMVVPWPGSENAPGWVNLHCHLKNTNPAIKGGKDFVVGWPFKTVDEFLNRATWLQSTATFYDVWFCTSQQREHAVNQKGKPKAKREAANATWLKAIWVDIDVKVKPSDWSLTEPWTHYETMGEAWGAFVAFRTKVGLPAPSAVVNSGGGVHVYWISDCPLSPDDWRPFAEGLKSLLLREGVKCDTGLTTDRARILRVPGTLNHKYSPPRPVNLVHLGSVYNFLRDITFLKNVAKVESYSASSSPKVAPPDPIEPGWSAAAPDPAFAALRPDDTLQAGLAPSGLTLVDPDPVFEKCGFLRHARDTGGADYDNPLWNLSVLCTAFMENGNEIAHRISQAHASYSQVDTQALYDRKVADRADRGIGYPSCAAIAGAGCKACASCPLFAQGKSPLNIRPAPAPFTATVMRPQSPTAVSLALPDGYDVDGDGMICKIVRNKEDEEVWLRLFHSTISDPWLQKEPDVIHFRTSYDKGNTIWTAVRVEDMCGQGFEKKLGAAKVLYVADNKAKLEGFFMAWVDVMRRAAEAQTPQAFGWYRENGDIKGFAYGGQIHRDDGTSSPAGFTDRVIQKRFTPAGQLAPWHKAASYVFRQKRPELDTVIATSFAAPLLALTGTTGAMLSAYGESGVGKTYALEVGVAVWGHPKQAKEVTSSTWKSIEHRLGSTVNLPVFWDEITNEKAQANALEMLMLTSGGVLGARQSSAMTAREKTSWSTLVSINSNICFKEYVAKEQPTHPAGLNRVLEYRVSKPTISVGVVSTSEADQALTELQHHYGNVGIEYAKVLAQHHKTIQARIDTVLANFNGLLKPEMEDRFWVGTIAALIVGAELAQKYLGVPFDVAALGDFLIKVYTDNRAGRAEAEVSTDTQQFAENLLTAFLKDHNMDSVWVDHTPGGPGKPQQTTSWRKLYPNAPMPRGVNVRYDQNASTILISKAALRTWLAARVKGTGMYEVLRTLTNNYGAVACKKTLNAGTPFTGGQEHAILIDARGNKALLDEIHRQLPDNSSLGASAGMSAAVVDTGIAPADEEVKHDAATNDRREAP